ncbi:MAG: hypothetical protein ACYTHN_01985 [Planctomycetota bacterium]|jgi:hypothetical protein
MIWCDFNCEHAAFPDAEMLGACRTMAGVFCRKLGKVVPKHSPCKAEEKKEDGPKGIPAEEPRPK